MNSALMEQLPRNPSTRYSPTKSFYYFLSIRSLPSESMPGVLAAIRALDDHDAAYFSLLLISPERLPSDEFLEALSILDRVICLRASLLVYTVTRGSQVPRLYQLEASLETENGRHSVVIAGTGLRKTLCIVIPLLLNPKTISITVSPLKWLQMMQVKDFAVYGITTAAINEDTSHSEELWKRISDGEISHLIVQPEQFKMYRGHLPRLARLLHDRKFSERIKRVHVDEAHHIYTAGTKKNGVDAFCPAWRSLDEVRARLPKAVAWQALSATLPPHILKVVDEKLCFPPNRRLIQLSINRPNITYATHVLVGGTGDFHNLDPIIPSIFHPPMCLPKLLIMHDNKAETNNASSHLNSRLPVALQSLGICKHYHSDMSAEYLEQTFSSFADPDGNTLILNGTVGAGTGIDIWGIDGVIQYGICTEVPEMFQRGGRGGRDRHGFAFFLIMIEPWVTEIDRKVLDRYLTDVDEDPDRPFNPSPTRKMPTKEDRCGVASIALVLSPDCIRARIASYFQDDSFSALEFTAKWCCDRHVGNGFCLTRLFLEPIYNGPEIVSAPAKCKRNTYRPVAQREKLETRLKSWLYDAYINDPLRFSRHQSSILDDTSIKTLTMAMSNTFNTSFDVTSLLDQSDEWDKQWSKQIFSVIKLYDVSISRHAASEDSDVEATNDDENSSDDEPLMKRLKERL